MWLHSRWDVTPRLISTDHSMVVARGKGWGVKKWARYKPTEGILTVDGGNPVQCTDQGS